MAALTTVTNGDFDTACAAVPAAVGGPLTRVEDFTADPIITPNSHLRVETTAAGGITIYISYDELVDSNVRNKLVLDAHGQQGLLARVFDLVTALDVFIDNGFEPLISSDEEFLAFMRLFQANLIPIMDSLPLGIWYETAPRVALESSFTEVFSDPDNTVTNTADQDGVSSFIWDWGDGETSTEWQPAAAHSYGSSGTYTTRLITVSKEGGVAISSGAANVVT